MTYLQLATVVPAFLIGTYLLGRRKGTPRHRQLGRIYLLLMMVTGLVTLFMPAQVGPRFAGHFGFIHSFSVLTLISAPVAWIAARHGKVKAHGASMVSLYVGGILIAGAFAFSPGRLLHGWLFGPAAVPSAVHTGEARAR